MQNTHAQRKKSKSFPHLKFHNSAFHNIINQKYRLVFYKTIPHTHCQNIQQTWEPNTIMEPHAIINTNVSPDAITITLNNKTTILISSNPGYINISFSFIKKLEEGNFLQIKDSPNIKLPNYINIEYKSTGD